MPISVSVLGEFALVDEKGNELSLPTRKTKALFAYLVVNADVAQRRDRLMTMFWSDRSEQQARHSLNQALAAIRKLGRDRGVDLLDSTARQITFRGQLVSSDIDHLRQAIKHEPEQVAKLYRGHLLDELLVNDPGYEEWLQTTRAELLGAVCDSLLATANNAETNGDSAAALQLYRRLLQLDPLCELAHRELIKLLFETGDRAGALRQYTVCAQILKKELQVEPDPDTQALIATIRNNKSGGNTLARSTRAEGATDSMATEAPIRVVAGAELFAPRQCEEPEESSRPCIAVMPFRNLAGEAENAYFCEGLSEDLIFALSTFQWFSVLARGSSFQFQGQDVDPCRVGRHLGARYVLDGSVRRSGLRLRISTALVATSTGNQLWAQHYECDVESLFDVQDDIVKQIVAAVELRLDGEEMQRALAKPVARWDVYDHVKRGNWLVNLQGPESMESAKAHFQTAMELDPNYAPALVGRANYYYRQAWRDFTDIRYQLLRAAHADLVEALGLEPDNPQALRYFASTSAYLGHQQQGLDAAARSVAVCPSFAQGYSGLAFTLDLVGRFEEAFPAIEETVRLRPYDRVLHRCIMSKAIAHYQTGDYESAEQVARVSLQVEPHWSMSNIVLLAVLGQKGELSEAREQARLIEESYRAASISSLSKALPFAQAEHTAHFEEGFLKAGLQRESR